LGIMPVQPLEVGYLCFQFLDGYSMKVVVFATQQGYSGTLKTTDEGEPVPTPVGLTPYGEMWQDDPYWFPLMLMGKRFTGRFVFDKMQLTSAMVHVGGSWTDHPEVRPDRVQFTPVTPPQDAKMVNQFQSHAHFRPPHARLRG